MQPDNYDDEKRHIKEAAKLLSQIQKVYADTPLRHFAAALKDVVTLGAPGLSDAEMHQLLNNFAEMASTVVAQKRPSRRQPAKIKYKTAVFKCLEDFDNCCKEHHRALCAALVSVCIARQIIPFVPKE